jgi:hypothetical protein
MASRSRIPKPGAAHRRCCWYAGEFFLLTDDAHLKARLMAGLSSLLQHVTLSAWEQHLLVWDGEEAAAACRVPALLISSRDAAIRPLPPPGPDPAADLGTPGRAPPVPRVGPPPRPYGRACRRYHVHRRNIRLVSMSDD